MEYIIACRFSSSFKIPRHIVYPTRGGGEFAEHPVLPLDDVDASALLFAYALTADEIESLPEVRAIVMSAFSEISEQFSGRLRVDLESVSIERGSIEISILISDVTVWLHDHELLFKGLAIWATDRFGGGFIGEYGRAFAGAVRQRLPFHGPLKRANIHSYEDTAEKKAQEIARAHHCKATPILGGIAVLDDGPSRRTKSYLYAYQLTGEGPKYLYVNVPRDIRRPPGFRVTDTELEISIVP